MMMKVISVHAVVYIILIALSNQYQTNLYVFAAVVEPATLPIIAFCAGTRYACAAFNNNKIKCWGDEEAWGRVINGYSDTLGENAGEIGDNLPYVSISDGSSIIKQLSCGNLHTCVRFASGSLKCVGSNEFGQVGIGVTTAIIGENSGNVGDGIIAVSTGTGLSVLDSITGSLHTCAVVTGNKVKCYGNNENGQLGYGDVTNRGTTSSTVGDSLSYVNLGTSTEVASIHSSGQSQHTCVILSAPTTNAQKIKCWGWNGDYQLGYGDENNRGDAVNEMGDYLAVVDLGSESKVSQLLLGYQHTCALLVSSVLKCFGANYAGQFGLGNKSYVAATGSSMPSVSIDSGKTIKLVKGGRNHICIVYDDMITVKCAGNNDLGQLGQGDTVLRGGSPTTMFPSIPAIDFGTGTTKISSFHSGRYFNCIVLENSLIKCWGSNAGAQLGIGSKAWIGDQQYEMGTNLTYAQLFSPTKSPTKSPSRNPTRNPTTSPTTASPTTSSPTTNEPTTISPTTTQPSKNPTINPTTQVPTNKPTTIQPTKNPNQDPTLSPVNAPTETPSNIPTQIPTNSPTVPITLSPTTTTPTQSPSTPTTAVPTQSPTPPTNAPTEAIQKTTSSPTQEKTSNSIANSKSAIVSSVSWLVMLMALLIA